MADFLTTTAAAEQAWNQDQMREPVNRPLFQLWAYDAPAVVLGCSQARLVTQDEIAQRAGIGSTPRQSGGGAVLAGPWMLSASIILPNGHPLASDKLVQSYQWIGELYAKILHGFGVTAKALPPEQARAMQAAVPPSLKWACFAGFSPWEAVMDKRKIVGLAQARHRTGTLVVGGLLLGRPDWELLARAMNQPAGSAAELAACTTYCAEQLGHDLSLAEVAAPLARALSEALDVKPS